MVARAAGDAATYLADVARVPPPLSLDALIALLTERDGGVRVSPTDRKGLHPYVIPLAALADTPTIIGLLRRPGDDAGRGLAVVASSRGGARLTLAARSPSEFVSAAALEAEALTSGTPRPKADAALVKAGVLTPELAERLVAAHTARGDEMSALISAEWYMRRSHFPGWGRPYDYAASVLIAAGRLEEARDCARVALALPAWSLRRPFADVAADAALVNCAGQTGAALAAAVRAALDAAEAGAGGLPRVTNRTDAQAAADAAAAALDDAVATESEGGGVDWGAAAVAAADALEAGGLGGVAAFVRGAA